MKKHQMLPILLSSLLLLSFTISSAELCHPEDKKTLFDIRAAFNNAYVFASWTPDSDCCTDWYLVKCDQTTNRVTSLFVINDNKVAGAIPDSVSNLTYLESLSFRNLPKLTGPIPQSIAKLKYLDSIWITQTGLSGEIPDFLGKFPKMNYINLQYNKLTGPIPASLALLSELNYLALDGNQLYGHIPDTFGAFIRNRDFYLKLSGNNLYGPIPNSLVNVDFTVVDLSRNKFTGDASMFFGTNKRLQILDLSRNVFSFDFSKTELPSTITSFDVSHNKIYGSIPESFTEVSDFHLDVSYNRLCGKIPMGGSLQEYPQSAYQHNKCLCGSPLPACKN